MKNHSFVPVKVLPYLPIINPYLHPINKNYAVNTNSNLKFKFSLSSPVNKKTYVRDAWSYEDVRLYLLGYGYRVCETSDYNTVKVLKKHTTQWKELKSITKYTFKLARLHGIIYCLIEIKDGNK